MKAQTWIWISGLVVVMGVIVWYRVDSSDREAEDRAVQSTVIRQDHMGEEQAPNFRLKNQQGKVLPMIPSNGKPTVLNFWASWCGPCKTEMPVLQQAFEQHKDQINFQMVNVTIDDDKKLVNQLLHKEEYTFPVLFDETGEASEVYQIISIPTTFVINSDGTVQKKIIGAMTEKQVQDLLASLHP